ncbi:hypothetical protein K505DRAFT_158508 [Melanomma pulvis-pyrius CBS 109.77]|uniref:Uncharacterized protein n=1 Tax=Melanomma pulvis-pyrius CBS 109.77 TaxID=1314802 RepID=A0A6A6WPV7_9PLEO|nr:hypothetical protein K505DRAFT_158508 [Melanomma pulvis-pyrius CBS 109.77]
MSAGSLLCGRFPLSTSASTVLLSGLLVPGSSLLYDMTTDRTASAASTDDSLSLASYTRFPFFMHDIRRWPRRSLPTDPLLDFSLLTGFLLRSRPRDGLRAWLRHSSPLQLTSHPYSRRPSRIDLASWTSRTDGTWGILVCWIWIWDCWLFLVEADCRRHGLESMHGAHIHGFTFTVFFLFPFPLFPFSFLFLSFPSSTCLLLPLRSLLDARASLPGLVSSRVAGRATVSGNATKVTM